MSKEQTEEHAAAPSALADFTSCPEWGAGGEFTYDPVTKTRTRDVPPAQAEAAVQPDETALAVVSTNKKERPRG